MEIYQVWSTSDLLAALKALKIVTKKDEVVFLKEGSRYSVNIVDNYQVKHSYDYSRGCIGIIAILYDLASIFSSSILNTIHLLDIRN